MDISKYTSFFHDGGIDDIKHIENRMIISMESAEMDKNDINEDITLSKYDTIQGKLHIEGIINITINEKPFSGVLKKIYDSGNIFDFELGKNYVKLLVSWGNYPPKSDIDDFSTIEIEAEKIWWENIPDLFD